MRSAEPLRVVMLGSDTKARGGIASVQTAYIEGGLAKRINLILVPTHSDGSFVFKMAVFLRSIVKIIFLNKKNTIFHIHLSKNGSFFRKIIIYVLIRRQPKVIFHLHSGRFLSFLKSHRFIWSLGKWMLESSSLLLTLSQASKIDIIRAIPKVNTVVLYNPAPQVQACQKKKAKTFSVLFLGLISDDKGAFDLLSVFSDNQNELRQKNISLILAGNGDVERAKKFVEHAGIQDLVKIPGWLNKSDRNAELVTCSVLILPSYHEQMPMSVLEAMAYGKAVIASRIAALPEMIEDGVNGVLIDPGDKTAVLRAITRLQDNPLILADMGAASRRIVDKKFSCDVILNQLINIYETL